jgi:hypothetical protein
MRLLFTIRATGLKKAYPNGKYIPPEVIGDEFSEWITKICKSPEVKTLIEIGSSSGEGSTSAIVKGLKDKKNWQLHLLEVDELRHEALRKKFLSYPQIFIHRYSSVSTAQYPSSEEVTHFYNSTATNLNQTPLDIVLIWLNDDKQGLMDHGLSDLNGIETIKQRYKISSFDFALVDGSEFTGYADTWALIGAKYLLLDDINSFKCYRAFQFLMKHPDYKLEFEDWKTRNGFAVFSKQLP